MNIFPGWGFTGDLISFIPFIETREIIVVEGLQFHEDDTVYTKKVIKDLITKLDNDPLYWKTPSKEEQRYIDFYKGSTWGSDEKRGEQIKKKVSKLNLESNLSYLESKLGSTLSVSADRKTAEYYNVNQRVNYQLTFKHTIADLKEAIETPEVIVVYSGHARYGRGPCMDVYTPPYPHHGDRWEDGDKKDVNGIFRMGYDYIPVPFDDLEHHRYKFRPVPVEDGAIPNEWKRPFSRHPECRRWLTKISLPAPYAPDPDNPSDIFDASKYVYPDAVSPSGKYWGFGKKIILQGGWDTVARSTYNLDEVEMQCRTFCHFGCSTKKHCWELVRKPEYKGWIRPDPPINRLAYFTTNPSFWKNVYWIYYLLAYDKPNDIENHFFKTHEYAKYKANIQLNAEGAGFKIY